MSDIDFELENKDLPKNKAIIILIGSILLGILFNILFYEETPAISCIIFVSAFYILFFINFREKLTMGFSINNILIIFILFLSGTYSLFTNPIFMCFNIIAIPFLIAVHTILTADRNKHSWYEWGFLYDLAYGVCYGAFAYIFKPIGLISNIINIKSDKAKYTTFRKVVIGIIVSLPLLFIIIGLLASADAVFKNLIDIVTNSFTKLNINSFVFQIIIIIIISILIFSYMWSLSIKKSNDNIPATLIEHKDKRIIDPVIVITILIMICLIYSLFTFIQFTYLFGSLNHSLPINFTYAEYARRGFWELIIVTLINLSILVINIGLTERKGNITYKTIQLLNSLLVFCTAVMLLSAHLRMTLYEKVYGYTYLRVFTHSFMLYISVLLLAALIKVWYEKLSLPKYYLIISLVAYTLINFANVDTLIANKNIERYHNTGKLDIHYLTSLSYEAVPQLVELLPELKAKDPKSAAKLENYLYIKKQNLNQWNSWQSYNFSVRRARKILESYYFKYDKSVSPRSYTQ